MLPPLLFLTGLSLLAFDEPDSLTRKPSAIAPSLPALTKEEEEKLDAIIDRFMLADTGKLRGSDARQALDAFDKLGMEAVPALIRGLNRAAKINHSCPVLMISRKLLKLLQSSEDPVLLEFARDEIGAGVTNSPHGRVLQDLRVRVLLRKNALALRPPLPPKAPSALTTAELLRAVGTLRGTQLRGILQELSKRDDKEALPGLLLAASSRDLTTQKLGREMLDQHLGRMSLSTLKEMTVHDHLEARKSAIRVIRDQHLDLVPSILERLTDADASVREEARQALIQLSEKREDFGPPAKATKEEQRQAQQRWKAWWLEKTSR